jgi:hypothetical protein
MHLPVDSSINKLIILFVFDKMETPLTENTVLDMCCSANNWVSYMDCQPILNNLKELGWISRLNNAQPEPLYTITPDGRVCLANFFIKIPASLREEITIFIKQNKLNYRKKQECTADYFKNNDGTYTVFLKIIEPTGSLMELKFVVATRKAAKDIYKKWEEKASGLYSLLYDSLVD